MEKIPSQKNRFMKKGTIKFYNPSAAFGFVKTDEGQELFFHITNVSEGTNPESLEEGTIVQFTEGMGRKGPQAEQVQLAMGYDAE
jgi:cold shock protein